MAKSKREKNKNNRPQGANAVVIFHKDSIFPSSSKLSKCRKKQFLASKYKSKRMQTQTKLIHHLATPE